MRHHVLLQIVAHGIHVPVGGIEQALHAIGGALTEDFGELPAILARDRREQAIEVAAGPGPHLGASKARRDRGMEGVKGSGTRRDNHRDRLLSISRSLSHEVRL